MTGFFVLVIPPCLNFFVAGTPTVWTPLPTIVLLPMVVVYGLAFLLPASGFLVSARSLLEGSDRTSTRFLVVHLILGALNAALLVVSWDYGLRWHGPAYTQSVAILSVSVWVVSAMIAVCSWRVRSFLLHFLSKWTLFLWLGWCAFPVLGELP